MHILLIKKSHCTTQKHDQISSGTIVVQNHLYPWMVEMFDVLEQSVLQCAQLDGDHKVVGKLNAKLITLGHIQDSHHVSHAQIWPRNLTQWLKLILELYHNQFSGRFKNYMHLGRSLSPASQKGTFSPFQIL